MDLIYWDHSYNQTLLLNFAIVIALFAALRLFSGTIAHINASDELLKKNNPAFGLSLAGVTFAVTILLTGLIYGDMGGDMFHSAIAVGGYGIVGIILMAVTRIIFDKIALPDISLRNEISKGNMAVAIADTSNVLAAAIIIRALMIWVTDNSIDGIFALLAGYALSQFILTGTTCIRRKMFSAVHKNTNMQDELKNGNIALALSFAGRKIGTAFAISIAANLIVYEIYDIKAIFLAWAGVSVAAILLLRFLSFVAERIILFRVNLSHEILEEKNIAVGALQGVIYISMAILLAEL
tara:strand:- start:55735 stop:56619 length:885 start_codon:yes stop_codon:yes gene_type:complete